MPLNRLAEYFTENKDRRHAAEHRIGPQDLFALLTVLLDFGSRTVKLHDVALPNFWPIEYRRHKKEGQWPRR